MHSVDTPPPVRLAALAANPVFRVVAICALLVGGFLACYMVPGLDEFFPPYRGAEAYRIDLDVYRIGAQVLLQGGDLYGELPDTFIGANLPFTYPPLSAILFTPLAVLPLNVGSAIFTAVSVLALGVTVWVVTRELTRLSWADAGFLAAAATAVLMWVGPVRETFSFGQVNNVLMMLVVVDLLVGRGKRWQGALVGLAMAIKLTPAVFLAYFLMRKDWRALAMGIISAAAYTAVGFLVTWRGSVQYWTDTLLSTDRIGNLPYVSNQSFNGLIRRLVLDDHTASLVWFASCAVVGLALLYLMWRLFRVNADAAAMCVMGMYALLASPVSWSHHWVWCVPALLVAAWLSWRGDGATRWAALAVTALGVWVFFYRTIWRVPIVDHGVPNWSAWQHVLGNAQLGWAVLFLALLALHSATAPRAQAAR